MRCAFRGFLDESIQAKLLVGLQLTRLHTHKLGKLLLGSCRSISQRLTMKAEHQYKAVENARQGPLSRSQSFLLLCFPCLHQDTELLSGAEVLSLFWEHRRSWRWGLSKFSKDCQSAHSAILFSSSLFFIYTQDLRVSGQQREASACPITLFGIISLWIEHNCLIAVKYDQLTT